MSNPKQDEILNILLTDARTSAEKIAKLTGRTVSDVSSTISDYENRGVIKKYKTVIDWEKLQIDQLMAFIDVKVIPARDVGFDAIAQRIYNYPEVKSVWLVSGDHDLRVIVEGVNVRDLGKFVAEKLATIEGVTATDTQFVLRRYKEDHELFVDAQEDDRLVVAP